MTTAAIARDVLGSSAALEEVKAGAYTIPTDNPEADGTYRWRSTTIVVVHVRAGGASGLGYTYSDCSAVTLLNLLGDVLRHRDAFDVPGAWREMSNAVRNIGRDGLAARAISALDIALWDLKAKLLGVSLASLFGRIREQVPIYGSGGFTSNTDAELRDQLSGWVERDGCRFVKMKIGSEPERDPERVRQAKHAIGDRELFVDANGALSPKQALANR